MPDEQPPTVEQPALQPVDQPEQTAAIPDSVSWSAPEFVSHAKSASWYLGLVAGAAVVAVIIYLLTKDFVSVSVIVVAAIIFGVYGARQPKDMQYRLDQRGISIGNKSFGYEQFKSFSVMPQEGQLVSIIFMPLKRFSTMATIYFQPQDQEKIVAVLSGALPYEEPRRDAVDSLMRKLKF